MPLMESVRDNKNSYQDIHSYWRNNAWGAGLSSELDCLPVVCENVLAEIRWQIDSFSSSRTNTTMGQRLQLAEDGLILFR